MAKQQELGRHKVVGSEVVPGFNGRVTVFHTAFDPLAEPISPELEQLLLENASSKAMRTVLLRSLAEAKGEK